MEFVNTLDPAKFSSTNGLWNSLMLNDPWSVGYVTTLIELKVFDTKESWEAFYYSSGETRQNLLSQLTREEQDILNDEQLVRTNKSKTFSLPAEKKALNTQHGRTKLELNKKGKILFDSLGTNPLQLTVVECAECVRFRVICETWNGVIVRERNTIAGLKRIFPQSDFRKVSGEVDHTYAVDYEVYKNDRLFCAIQIKPPSYLWNAPYIIKAREANRQKNLAYHQINGVNVFDVIAKGNGTIENQEVLSSL